MSYNVYEVCAAADFFGNNGVRLEPDISPADGLYRGGKSPKTRLVSSFPTLVTESSCNCDRTTSTCIDREVVGAVLTAKEAVIVASVLAGLPGLVVLALGVSCQLSLPMFVTLLTSAGDMFTDVYYTMTSQYASSLYLDWLLTFAYGVNMVPYVSIMFLGLASMARPDTGPDTPLWLLPWAHNWPRMLPLDRDNPSMVLIAVPINCVIAAARIAYSAIVGVVVGPLLWQSELMLIPSVFRCLAGGHAGKSIIVSDSGGALFDARLYHCRVLWGWLCRSVPLIVLQAFNNQELTAKGINGWDAISIVSLGFSCFQCIIGLYTFYGQWKAHGMELGKWHLPSLGDWMPCCSKGAEVTNIVSHV